MGAESASDRASFFDTDDFGVAALWNGTTTVNGIFDSKFIPVNVDTDVAVAVESAQPMFRTRTADVSTVAQGDTLVISGTTYDVVGIQPDGTGMIDLILEEQ